jgi:hypothetical protein
VERSADAFPPADQCSPRLRTTSAELLYDSRALTKVVVSVSSYSLRLLLAFTDRRVFHPAVTRLAESDPFRSRDV